MWDCIKCGCLAIAQDLGFCPQCFKPKEGDMPKGTTGGASNADAEPGEPGYIDPEASKAPAAKVLADAGFDPKDVAKVIGTGEPEKPAEAPDKPKLAVPAVDLRPSAAPGSAPVAGTPKPAA